MKKIDNRSLKLNVYEYFKYCNETKRIRGVGVITDKQYVFYTQTLNNDYASHDEISRNINNEIYPHNQKDGWVDNENFVYIASIGEELIINMPRNGKLSFAQAEFLCDVLNQTDKYNNERREGKPKIKIDLFGKTASDSYFDVTDIESLKEKIQEQVTLDVNIEEENIIGTTLPREKIKNNLLKSIQIEKCSNMKEIIEVLKKCSVYYNDSYYKNIIEEIFPNYIEIEELIYFQYGKSLEYEKVENATFENIKEVMYSYIKNIFKYKKSYSEISQFLFSLKGQPKISEVIEQKIFPNFKLISDFFIDIYPSNEEETKYINNILSNISSYEDFAKVVCNLAYNKNNHELIENQKGVNKVNDEIEKIKIEKNIVASKDILNEMIDKRNDLEKSVTEYDFKLIENSVLVNQEKSIQENRNIEIEKLSSNLLKKIINKRKIKEQTNELNSSKSKTETLKNEEEEISKQIEKLKKEIKDIEKKFKDITHLDYFPFDKSLMTIYYTRDNSEYEELLHKNVDDLTKKINLLKEKLVKITETGLVMNGNKVHENIEEATSINSISHHH